MSPPNFVASTTPVASPFEHLPEERLAPTPVAVDVCGVEKRDAGVESRVDDGARPLEIDPHAEVVATEADDRDFGPLISQSPRAHERRC